MKLNASCREVTQMVLLAEDRHMPLVERLIVRLHQRRCANCRRFERQVQLMRQASARWRQYSEE